MSSNKKYKVIPCICSKGKKGFKIVTDDDYEDEYLVGGGMHFTVYRVYEDALRDCEHLNGKGKVFGFITQDSWDVLRAILKGEA